MLKKMRRGKKWWAAVSCGYRQVGWIGLLVGMMIATQQKANAMIVEVDHEGITGGPTAHQHGVEG